MSVCRAEFRDDDGRHGSDARNRRDIHIQRTAECLDVSYIGPSWIICIPLLVDKLVRAYVQTVQAGFSSRPRTGFW